MHYRYIVPVRVEGMVGVPLVKKLEVLQGRAACCHLAKQASEIAAICLAESDAQRLHTRIVRKGDARIMWNIS